LQVVKASVWYRCSAAQRNHKIIGVIITIIVIVEREEKRTKEEKNASE